MGPEYEGLLRLVAQGGAGVAVTGILLWVLRELLAPEGKLVTRRQADEMVKGVRELADVYKARAEAAEVQLASLSGAAEQALRMMATVEGAHQRDGGV